MLPAAVAPRPNRPATGQPTITGVARVGETLTADTSSIADADGLDNAGFVYQWLTDDAEIQNATGSSYILANADEGITVKVRISFTDDAGNQETLTSAATDAVSAATQPNDPATGAPAITGTVQVGETLTAGTTAIADEDGLTNVSYTYQWLADDTAIQGATLSCILLHGQPAAVSGPRYADHSTQTRGNKGSFAKTTMSRLLERSSINSWTRRM